MAGIFLWNKSESFNPEEINKVFSELNYRPGKHLTFNDWNVIVFPKSSYDISNYLISTEGIICGTGTFGYKGKVYEQALPLIFEDIKTSNLNLTNFWGSFLIFCCTENQSVLIRDGALLARFHGIKSKPVYSSSFVGLMRCTNKKLSFDKEAATELLSTGLITGNSTIVKEIEFITERETLIKLDYLLTNATNLPTVKNREEALSQQLEILRNYIIRIKEDWFSYMPESHFNVSITGGLDSRLLTALVIYSGSRFDFYTYWRESESKDPDFILAKIIADHLDVFLNYRSIVSSEQLTDEKLEALFSASHNDCDGVIRPGTFWDEELSTSEYRSSLSRFPYLRLTGFEGEYYRNMERLPQSSMRSFQSWIHWEMIYRFAGNNFLSRKAERETEERILYNLEMLLGQGNFNLTNYKTYYRKVVVPSYRSLQTNIENRVGFLASPFADTNISEAAINCYPYLGKSLQFEVDMLRSLSHELAGLPNDYGFNFMKGEVFYSRLGVEVWQILPPAFKHKLFSFYRKGHQSDYVRKVASQSRFISSLLEVIQSADLPLDIDGIARRAVRGKLVLNIGYFLKNNEKWLQW